MGIVQILGDEAGQGMVEYGLILLLVSVALVGALVLFAPKIGMIFETAGGKVAEAIGG